MEGHTYCVVSLAESGDRLVSGIFDGRVRVWGMEGGASKWRCERDLDGTRTSVYCVVGWEGWLAGGCEGGDILVWGTETWGLERTLRGHAKGVVALVKSDGRLISSSLDRTL